MPLDFLDKGEYAVTLGKSFDNDLRKSSRQYLAIKKNKGSQFDGYTKHAALDKEKENDKYNLEMKSSEGQNVAFDADLEAEEYQCVVIYNHDTKSFRIERIGAVINLSRKNTEEIEEGAIIESPIVDRRQEIEKPIAAATDGPDDFDFELTKDLDEILGDDEEEEDEDEDVEMTAVPIEINNNSNSNNTINNNSNNNNNNSNNSESDSEEDQFEEISTIPIALPPSYSSHGESVSPMSLPVTPSLPQVVASPSLPANLQLPGTPIASSSTAATTPTNHNNATNGSTPTKKRKFKKFMMASAPIRHPGTLSPMVAPTPPPVSRVEPKRLKSDDEEGSSSGSEESSSGSESGSTETESSSSGESESESGSSSDDEDFESLAQDISMSLSKDGPSAPASPQLAPSSSNTNGMSVPSPSTFGRSPYSSINTPTPTRNASGNTGAGPMSLRALFKEDDEEEDLSSSSSDND